MGRISYLHFIECIFANCVAEKGMGGEEEEGTAEDPYCSCYAFSVLSTLNKRKKFLECSNSSSDAPFHT